MSGMDPYALLVPPPKRLRVGGRGPSGSVEPELRIAPGEPRGPQSYRVTIADGVHVTGADEAGLFYGVCTLHQLLEQGELRELELEDWPDLAHRGVMLDISRDRVPTMNALLDLVDRLASFKINQLQLYMEHTFAYRGHERVWRDASPLTPEEIVELDAHCRARHVELVPNQNSFGHMHRWLTHEPYRQLAECPGGVDHPFSPSREPFSLCPTDPKSLELLADLYDQLLPCFTSRLFNVGLDETFDLGLGRSAERCARIGAERVYLEFLGAVHRLVNERGRRMQFWGDIILKRPELIAELPRDAVALEWGYEADHPFDSHAALFAGAGLEFYVCPGTSSWSAIAGRVDNALGNIARAAAAGLGAGAAGLLVTDWGDHGHLQPPLVSWPGFLAAARHGWDARSPVLDGDTLAAQLDRWVFFDRAGVMGRASVALGNAYQATGVTLRNGTILSRLLLDPGPWPVARIPTSLTAAGLERARAAVERAASSLSGARSGRADAALLLREQRWVADALALACGIGLARLGPGLDSPLAAVAATERAALAGQMAALIAEHRALWLERSRPGGLDDSAARLERTLAALRAA